MITCGPPQIEHAGIVFLCEDFLRDDFLRDVFLRDDFLRDNFLYI